MTPPASQRPTRAPAREHPAHAIRLPHLPPQGLAIEHQGRAGRRRLVLVNLHGDRLASLRGFTIENASDRPGPVLLLRRHDHYELRPKASMLRPITEQHAELVRANQGAFLLDGPDLPRPPGQGVGESGGRWRWMTVSPRGRILAQWSGECEVPTAYLVDAQEGGMVPVTGVAAPSSTPESTALGWTRNDQALAVLPEGACSMGADVPGIYRFTSAGNGTRIVATPRGALVRMWNPSEALHRP
jgi:hypothetical protein